MEIAYEQAAIESWRWAYVFLIGLSTLPVMAPMVREFRGMKSFFSKTIRVFGLIGFLELGLAPFVGVGLLQFMTIFHFPLGAIAMVLSFFLFSVCLGGSGIWT